MSMLNGLGDLGIGEFKDEGFQRGTFSVASFFSQKIEAGGGGDFRQPVGERGVAAEFVQVFVEANKDFLGEILELMIVSSVARGCGKDAAFVFADQCGKGGIGATEGVGDELGVFGGGEIAGVAGCEGLMHGGSVWGIAAGIQSAPE